MLAVVGDSASCDDVDCAHLWCTAIELRIADCDRVCSLDFDLDTASSRKNSLYKIGVLIDTLTQFQAALEVEVPRAARYEAARRRAWRTARRDRA